jgi:hypothetical protein
MHSHAFSYSFDPFSVKFDPCTREPQDWKEQMRTLARKLANGAGSRPIIVCAGGRIGSELICRALFEEGIHFSVVTVEYTDGANREDVEYARAWCIAHGIEQKVITLDMAKFFSKDIERYITEGYRARNLFRYFQLFLLETVESLGGYAVLGCGAQMYRLASEVPREEDVYLQYERGLTVPIEWMDTNNTSHCAYFFASNPEMCLAYLRIPIVDFAVRHPSIFSHENNRSLFKRLVYQSLWPDIVPRKSMSGYDRIKPLRIQVQNKLMARFGESIEMYRLPVVQFRQQLEGDM